MLQRRNITFLLTVAVFSWLAVSECHINNIEVPETFQKDITKDGIQAKKSSFPCPEAEDISPCVCSIVTAGLKLDCSLIESDSQLATIFLQPFPKKDFWQFYIYENDYLTQLFDIFNGVSFNDIYIHQVPNLVSISDSAFDSSQQALLGIDISHSNLTDSTFPFDELVNFPHLFYITFRDSELVTFPAIESSTVRQIAFSYGDIPVLSSRTFRFMSNLNSWDIYDQDILLLEESTFQFSNEYNYINVAYNQITVVEPGTFLLPNGTDNLSIVLNFYQNNLDVLDEAAFGDIFPFVADIDLRNNPLICGCDIAWVVTNPDYLSAIDRRTICTDGTLVWELDPELYASCKK